MTDPLTDWCRSTLSAHLARHPADAGRLADLIALLADPPGPLHDRRTLPGHVTASGVVVDLAARRVLLIHHGALGRWLPPGGHVEAGELPPAAARREVQEEVGVAVGPVLSPDPDRPMPIDVDSHPIPANDRRGEPAHAHHDFRFAFAADPADPLVADAAEVSAAEWVGFDDQRIPANLRPALEKLAAADRLWPID
jgi:8-oxo-dGTP pyrophosphatase MutT (NUDIX family)